MSEASKRLGEPMPTKRPLGAVFGLGICTGLSAMFVAGAAAENVHSFGFALYVGGTVAAFLAFVVALVEAVSHDF